MFMWPNSSCVRSTLKTSTSPSRYLRAPQLAMSSSRSSPRTPSRGLERSAGIAFHAAPSQDGERKKSSSR